jgi:hypothetical protein
MVVVALAQVIMAVAANSQPSPSHRPTISTEPTASTFQEDPQKILFNQVWITPRALQELLRINMKDFGRWVEMKNMWIIRHLHRLLALTETRIIRRSG